MKTRLNIICLLIFVAIIGSIVNTFDIGGHDFAWGFQEGQADGKRLVSRENRPKGENVFLTLKPTIMGHFSDSIYNEASAKWVPVQYREVVVKTDEDITTGMNQAFIMILVLFVGLSAVVQFITFLRLIYVVNKSVIFDWSNIVKLRIIGIAMLLSFIAYALYSYLSYISAIENINLGGYIISKNEMWDFSFLIPGLSILLIAEIFAIGLRMKEDQELTI